MECADHSRSPRFNEKRSGWSELSLAFPTLPDPNARENGSLPFPFGVPPRTSHWEVVALLQHHTGNRFPLHILAPAATCTSVMIAGTATNAGYL